MRRFYFFQKARWYGGMGGARVVHGVVHCGAQNNTQVGHSDMACVRRAAVTILNSI